MLHAWEKFGEIAAQETHWAKFQSSNKKYTTPAYRAVLRGKIDFLGFVKGRDSGAYVTLLQRLQALAPEMKAKPILIRRKTHELVIRQSIWLLRDKHKNLQGTAFAISHNRLVTAAHNLEHDFMWASRPSFSSQEYFVSEVWKDENLILLLSRYLHFYSVHLEISSQTTIDLVPYLHRRIP